MATESEETHENVGSPTIGVEKQNILLDSNEQGTKTRYPRWTRQETLVLIQAKAAVEARGRHFRRYTSPPGFDQPEPKWDSISSFCKHHRVNRESVQCRKRWSNLVCDFKKIKKWESNVKGEAESFWVMRNDFRKENKLPGFFDKEVYNALDGKGHTTIAACPLTIVTYPSIENNEDRIKIESGEEDEEEAVFDSSRYASSGAGLFSDFEQSGMPEEVLRSPQEEAADAATRQRSKKATSPLLNAGAKETIVKENFKKKDNRSIPNSVDGNFQDLDFQRETMSQGASKRRRLLPDDSEGYDNFSSQFVEVLKRNSNALQAHLDAQIMNYQLENEQRKEQTDRLVAALNKLTDAMVRIADKL